MLFIKIDGIKSIFQIQMAPFAFYVHAVEIVQPVSSIARLLDFQDPGTGSDTVHRSRRNEIPVTSLGTEAVKDILQGFLTLENVFFLNGITYYLGKFFL